MHNQQFTNLVASIDKDIEIQDKKASEFLSVAYNLLSAVIILICLYVLPSIAERNLPKYQLEIDQELSVKKELITQFEKKYQKKFYHVDDKLFETINNSGGLNDEIKEARIITAQEKTSFIHFVLQILNFFKMDDSKLESLFKFVPIALGTVLASFLFIYRFHALASKELMNKKIDLISANINAPTQEGASGTNFRIAENKTEE